MPNYSKNDIILVQYPFSDLSSSKVRPAVVVIPFLFEDAPIELTQNRAVGAIHVALASRRVLPLHE